MRKLDVINAMLGSMGEAPLNSLEEPHGFKGAMLGVLTRINQARQSIGWYFNRETVTLPVSATDSAIYVPTDTLGVYGKESKYVLRGRRLYDASTGSVEFTAPATVTLIRAVPLEDLPELPFQCIAAESVYTFQKNYDGDSTKTRDLKDEFGRLLAELRAEDTRQARANMVLANPRLALIKLRARRYTY